jgi:hypothetical protein
MNTKTYHMPLDGLPAESSYGMGRQDVASLDEPDPTWWRLTSELGVTVAWMYRAMQLQTPKGLYIRR